MGLSTIAGYQPKENSEFGPKKKLIGEAVCVASMEEITAKKNGKKWLVLKAIVSHPVPDPKGRETTLEPGDEVPFFYDPSDDKSVKKMADDLFTAGIEYDKAGSEADIQASIISNVSGKLVYVKTYAHDKTEKDIEKYGADPSYFQNQKILSANKITDDLKTPVLPF